ncbi:EAL domain-containing protein [Cellulomonas soli]|uniref:sensor domain-containing protein n=1 Tax=Cellulomonas soli TaxID=931535 RepID=UPI003F85054E
MTDGLVAPSGPGDGLVRPGTGGPDGGARAEPSARVVLDASGRILEADRGFGSLVGRPAALSLGQPFTSVLSPAARLYWLSRWASATPEEGRRVETAVEVVGVDGTTTAAVARVQRAEEDADAGAVLDVTLVFAGPRRAYERRLQDERRAAARAAAGARALLASTPDPVVVIDAAARVLEWNPAAERVLHQPREKALGSSLPTLLGGGSPLRTRALSETLARGVAGRESESTEVLRADGSLVAVDVSVVSATVDGEPVWTVVLRERVTWVTPGALAAEVAAAAGAPDLLVLGVEPDGTFDLVEGVGPTTRGVVRADLVGRPVAAVLGGSPEGVAVFEEALAGRAGSATIHLAGREWSVSVRPRLRGDGGHGGAVAVVTDLTTSRAAQDAARRHDRTDGLTGLLNRRGLVEAIEQEMARPGVREVALLQLDLDDFVDLNDSLGPTLGDRVIAEQAVRLARAVPAGAIVARHGGDELAVLLGPDVADQPDLLGRRLARALAAPIVLPGGDGESLVVPASVGISRWPQDAVDADQLLAHADVATRFARVSGREVASYDEREDGRRNRFRLVARLRHALATGGLCTHFQPVVGVEDRRLHSVETLVRWTDEELGVVVPSDLVAAAEAARLIDDVGAVVIDHAFGQVAAWDAAALTVQRVAVNVSPWQLRGRRLEGALDASSAWHGIGLDRVTLELTESAVADLDDVGTRVLHRLRDRGVLVAVDDFGTGHSSLARLRELPVDVVKLDRSFVKDLPGAVPAALVTAFVGVASALGLRTVAEGIETEEQWAELRRIGCTDGQGYLFGRPVPGGDLRAS